MSSAVTPLGLFALKRRGVGGVVLNAYGKKNKNYWIFFFKAVVKVVQGVSLHVQTVMELCAAFPAEPFALIYDREDVTDIQANSSG